jgi:site-specific DNA recombinase
MAPCCVPSGKASLMGEALLAAIYARVSSEQQAEDHTIASQVAALRARVAEDGLQLPVEREFLDEGYSGATLIRPALEQVRDLIASGEIDRLYVHSPDRLARRYAYQALLLDEFSSRWSGGGLSQSRPGPIVGR